VRNPQTLPPVYYASLYGAYNDTSNTLDGDTLQLLGTSLPDTGLNLTRPIAVTLDGGYDCYFNGNTSYSFMQGTLTISSGTVTINNLVLL